MSNIKNLLVKAAAKALEDEMPDFENIVSNDLNIFESVDSFSVVNILLESELVIETLLGKYVPLANEKIFDAMESPFLKWSNWVDYVTDIAESQRG